MTWLSPVSGILGFLCGFLTHLLIWRLKRPRDDFKALALTYLSAGILSLTATASLNASTSDILGGLIVCTSLSVLYIIWYPAAQAASPTMLLSILIYRSKPNGISRKEIEEQLQTEKLCQEGIENLFHENFVAENDSGIYMKLRGQRTLKIIRGFRNFIGLQNSRG